MNLTSVSITGPVATMYLDKAPTNPLDNMMVNELSQSLSTLEKEEGVTSVILTSSNDKIFSFGFNLPELIELDRPDFEAFFENFNKLCIQLYTFPKPLLASVNGYAIAGGCILALCCDYRLVASGKNLMGLNEVKLGVPVPWTATVILRELLGKRLTEQMLLSGRLYSPSQLLQNGIADELCNPEDLKEISVERAIEFGSCLNAAYRDMKRELRQKVVNSIMDGVREHDKRFIDLWYSEEAQELLKEAAKKF